jgi:hypothetical protein
MQERIVRELDHGEMSLRTPDVARDFPAFWENTLTSAGWRRNRSLTVNAA